MADKPSPVAPLRSMTAFSARTTRRRSPAQNLASKAAPQPDIPPPITRMSQSTVSVVSKATAFLHKLDDWAGFGVGGWRGGEFFISRAFSRILGWTGRGLV